MTDERMRTLIAVQPDKQYGDWEWVNVGFSAPVEAGPELVVALAVKAVKAEVALRERTSDWVWDQMAPFRPPKLSMLQGSRERLLTLDKIDHVAEAKRRREVDAEADWTIEIRIRRPLPIVPKYVDVLGPDEGYEAYENMHQSVQKMLGSETPKVRING